MNNNLKNSITGLLSEVNRDEMWNKFFNSVEYSNGFLEALEAYKNLDGEITNLVYDVEDMQLGEEFDLFKSIKEDKANLLEEQGKLQKVLDLYGDDLPVVNKEAYEERLSQIPDEIKKVDERSYDVFDKQREEVKIKIEEKKVSLNKWYGYLLSSFGAKGGIKEQMISKAEEYKVNLDKEYDRLKNKLENVKKNLEFAIKQEEEAKKFGETSSQYLEAAKAKHDKYANVISVENEIKEFKNRSFNDSIESVKFIKFLREMTFWEFFERLQNNGYNLKFGAPVFGDDKPEKGNDVPKIVPVDGDVEPSKEVPSTTVEPKEKDDTADKEPRVGGLAVDSGKEKEKNIGKKKVKEKRDIPESVFDKIKKIVPAMKNFFGKFGKRSVKEQSNLVTSVSENEYVASDKELLSNIASEINNSFGKVKDDSKKDYYRSLYSKISKLSDEEVREVFNGVSNKEEILINITNYCNLSKEEYDSLLGKIDNEVVSVKSR